MWMFLLCGKVCGLTVRKKCIKTLFTVDIKSGKVENPFRCFNCWEVKTFNPDSA